MNTENANKYLDSLQISERSIYDRKDIEHPLDCLLEDYHQEQLKLLGIGDVSQQRELLIALLKYYENKPLTIGLEEPELLVDKFLAINCG